MLPSRTAVATLASALLLLSPSLPAQAVPTTSATPAQVMIVGSYHMGSTGDQIQADDDVLTERRQREIAAVVEALARFRPTRIALEVPLEQDSLLNAAYAASRAGTRPLARSESEQIGFRLAMQLGHARVYAVDFRKNEDMMAVVGHAARTGRMDVVQQAQQAMGRIQADMERRVRTLSVGRILAELNAPAADSLEALYLLAATVGPGAEGYVGADVVAGRFERNLKIFANIARVAEPGERVLVLYGSGHGKLLRQFVHESPALQLARVDPYLASLH